MKKILTFSLFLIFCASAKAQKMPSLWLSGTNEFPDTVPGYGNMMIRFDDTGGKAFPMALRMTFEGTMASAANATGELLFYTNGCYVADFQGDTMPGGTGLNPGEVAQWVCGADGYISPKGAMALPRPGRPGQYLLLHMGARYDPARKITYGPLYYSVIDMNLNGGRGMVTSKNNVLLDDDLEPFAVVRHGNGRDWWVICPVYNSNRYYRFLLTPNGISSGEQAIGPILGCRRIGSSTFSPNGQRYGRQQNCGTVIMNFDRCTGIFSTPIRLNTQTHTFGGGGIGFSPDGSHVFTTSQLAVLSADLNKPSPVFDTLVHTFDNWTWGTSMGHIQQGPDNHLYISNMAREKYFSRVYFPEPTGAQAVFEFKALPLPRFSVRTTPHEPNHRLGDLKDSPCDTLGINALFEPPKEAFTLVLAPNPASDWLVLQSEISITAIQVLDLMGRETLRMENPENRLKVSTLKAGSYLLKAYNAQGQYVVRKFVICC